MSNTTDDLLRAGFQDAVRRPDRPAPSQPPLQHGPRAGMRPDRSAFLLSIDRIRPDDEQVRRFNKSATDPTVLELTESIRAVGILQPIDVRYHGTGDYYQIVAGERRFVAAKLAHLSELPVKLVDADDNQARRLQLLENIHRADLLPIELAVAIQSLADAGSTTDELLRILCKGKSFITKALSIARNLSDEAKKEIHRTPERFTSMDHLYEVSMLAPLKQLPILLKIADERLTRDQLLQLTAEAKQEARTRSAPRGGRPARGKHHIESIDLVDALVTVRFRRPQATKQDVRDVLRKALDTLTP